MADRVLEGSKTGGNHSGAKRSRLSEARPVEPWVRAEKLESCYLYWMPVSRFPMIEEERLWLIQFMNRLSGGLKQSAGLRGELFLQFRSASQELADRFRAYALKCQTLLGLGRRPGADLPRLPTNEQLKQALEDGKSFDLSQWVGDYCYWFRNKRAEEQRQLFLGYGGMTTFFLAPDAKTAPPDLPFTPAFRDALPVFKAFDIDALVQGAFALHDGFLARSKRIFGEGLEDKPEFDAIMYIVPLLSTGHFFAVSEEERNRWFELFDVYINESPADGGVVLAFQKNFEPMLIQVLDQMKSDGLEYPSSRGRRK